MLGRLGLHVEEAIEAYQDVFKEALSEKRLFGDDTALKMTNLKNVINRIVERYAGRINAPMANLKSTSGECKTFVCVMLADNMTAGIPVLIRSYDVLENDGPECTITQAARATSAMTGGFKPATISELGMKWTYLGGGFGNNNPTTHMLAEAGRVFVDQNVSFILSIGAGHLQPVGWSRSKNAPELGMSIATDNERVAEEMARRFQYTVDLYFRFNVDQGLQRIGAMSWEKVPEAAVHSRQ